MFGSSDIRIAYLIRFFFHNEAHSIFEILVKIFCKTNSSSGEVVGLYSKVSSANSKQRDEEQWMVIY